MTYQNIQFIAYVLNTKPALDAAGRPVYPGLADAGADRAARCALMARAMESALPQADPSRATLKVFMAPEFFFRGCHGAYAMDDVVRTVQALQDLAAGERWRDWLFVFGSIVAHDIAPESGRSEVYNFTLVQRGGRDNAGFSGSNVLMKQWMSGQAFLPVEAPSGAPYLRDVLYEDMVDYVAANDDGAGGAQREEGASDVFASAGIMFALEICRGQGSDPYQPCRSPQLPGAALAQIQMIPSCGTAFSADRLMTGPGGYVFQCDGGGHGASVIVPGKAARQPGRPFAIGGADVDSGAGAVPLAQLFAAGQDGTVAGATVIFASMPTPQPYLQPLIWAAIPSLQFIFSLSYNEHGAFKSLQVSLVHCATPLGRCSLESPGFTCHTTVGAQALTANFTLVRGGNGYDHGLECQILFGGLGAAYDFDGIALEFYDKPQERGRRQPADWRVRDVHEVIGYLEPVAVGKTRPGRPAGPVFTPTPAAQQACATGTGIYH